MSRSTVQLSMSQVSPVTGRILLVVLCNSPRNAVCHCHRSISAVENLSVAAIGYGEGWHNYHHVFPWDYKAAELGTYQTNLTTGLIDFFSRIGWAYDLKTVSVDMIRRRAARTGDGSRHGDAPLEELHETDNTIWGWGDKDMPEEDVKDARIYNKCD